MDSTTFGVILSIFLYGVPVHAALQEPSPTPSIDSQITKKNSAEPGEKTAANPQGTAENPLIIKRLDAEESPERRAQQATEREEKATNERRLVFWTLILAVLTGALAIVAGVQVGMFWIQLGLMRKATQDAGDAAKAAKTSAEAVMLAERAYVKMSHVPPGIQWNAPDERGFTVTINVKNYGRTPASVTDVVLSIKVLPNEESLPVIPDYSIPPREEIPSAFLMPGDWFNYTRSFGLFEKLEVVKDKSSKVYVYGYVDYIDVFHRRQRGGYARVYNRWIDDGAQNNLVLVTQRGYNYDRQREEGEGNDWGALSQF